MAGNKFFRHNRHPLLQLVIQNPCREGLSGIFSKSIFNCEIVRGMIAGAGNTSQYFSP
jgi:hypothetical protein